MKIKLTEPGWETYTGDLGPIPFENGVSTREVNALEASRIANVVRVENVADGSNPSTSQLVLESQCIRMDGDMVRDVVSGVQSSGAETANKVYTNAELEEIADRDGINGLRKIGDTLGVKAQGIAKLIALILEAQGGKVEAGVPAAGAPVEVKPGE